MILDDTASVTTTEDKTGMAESFPEISDILPDHARTGLLPRLELLDKATEAAPPIRFRVRFAKTLASAAPMSSFRKRAPNTRNRSFLGVSIRPEPDFATRNRTNEG